MTIDLEEQGEIVKEIEPGLVNEPEFTIQNTHFNLPTPRREILLKLAKGFQYKINKFISDKELEEILEDLIKFLAEPYLIKLTRCYVTEFGVNNVIKPDNDFIMDSTEYFPLDREVEELTNKVFDRLKELMQTKTIIPVEENKEEEITITLEYDNARDAESSSDTTPIEASAKTEHN